MTLPVPVPVSQFPDASLPLSGDEYVPLVQSGVTRKVPSASFATFSQRFVPEVFKAVLAGIVNDVEIEGAARLFIDTADGDTTITGFATSTGWQDGQFLIVTNSGAANSLTLAIETGSSPENQIYGVTDLTLPPHGSKILCYSATLEKLVML
jgi:hypothetical protein